MHQQNDNITYARTFWSWLVNDKLIESETLERLVPPEWFDQHVRHWDIPILRWVVDGGYDEGEGVGDWKEFELEETGKGRKNVFMQESRSRWKYWEAPACK